MARFELVMPKMGESIMEATILKWKKNVGDAIAMDETLLEIATDKVDSEVPSTAAGQVVEILFKENDVVPVGKVIAVIESEQATVGNSQTAAPAAAPKVEVPFVPAATQNQPTATNPGDKFYSPLVLNIARQEGISMSELENIAGTGQGGRVTKSDILSFVESRKLKVVSQQPTANTAPKPVVAAPSAVQRETSSPKPATISSGNVEIVEMDRMRKLIAEHMVRSKATSPHVTSFAEADVTNLVNWREKVKKSFEKKEGEKITFTPIFVEAVAKALKEFPFVNASVDGTSMILKRDINIGMATATPNAI